MSRPGFPSLGAGPVRWHSDEKPSGKMSFEETAEFHGVTCTKATEKALLCMIDYQLHWIPKSQIDLDSEVQKPGDTGCLLTSLWIATQKDLV